MDLGFLRRVFVLRRDFACDARGINHADLHRNDPKGPSRRAVYSGRQSKQRPDFEVLQVVGDVDDGRALLQFRDSAHLLQRLLIRVILHDDSDLHRLVIIRI